MALFQKGKSGNPLGRQKTPEWSKLAYWFKTLQSDLNNDELKIRDKAYIKLECIKLILGKKPLAAKTPADSASNAKDALKLLKSLEGTKRGPNPSSTPDSSTDSVANRRSDVQAKPDPAQHEDGLGDEQKPQ